MDREKQIEEMAEAIFQNGNYGLFFSEAEKIARFVIEEQGYRKQSDVASDIFTDICAILESHRISHFDNIFDDKLMDDIAELKKKYTKGDTE